MRARFSSRLMCSLLFACAAMLGPLLLGEAHAERRAAIVVGNSDYPFAPLTNPRSDAKLIANTNAQEWTRHFAIKCPVAERCTFG